MSESNPQGYECRTCGYVPTADELQRGSCPDCAEARRASTKQSPEGGAS